MLKYHANEKRCTKDRCRGKDSLLGSSQEEAFDHLTLFGICCDKSIFGENYVF